MDLGEWQATTPGAMIVDAASLRDIGLLDMLSAEEHGLLETRCQWQSYNAREQIFPRDSETTNLHFVVRGSVRVISYTPSGRKVSFEDIGTGGCFGELAAIDGEPRSASVMTLEEAVIATLSQGEFTALVKRNPEFALAVMRRLSRTVRQATERIFELSTIGPQNRIHAELLRLAGPGGSGGTAEIRPIPVHADIASRVSTTRETVVRTLSELARQGILQRDADCLLILDVARLEEMVKGVKDRL